MTDTTTPQTHLDFPPGSFEARVLAVLHHEAGQDPGGSCIATVLYLLGCAAGVPPALGLPLLEEASALLAREDRPGTAIALEALAFDMTRPTVLARFEAHERAIGAHAPACLPPAHSDSAH